MDCLSSFGESVSEIIFENKITAGQFAETVGIAFSEVYRYLRKEYLPKLYNMVKIADRYNYSVDYMLGLIEFPPNVKFKQTPPFDARFKEILTEMKLTRYRLSKETKISINRIDDWYHGRFTPSLEKAFKLTEYFNCSFDYLLGRE